MAEVGQVQCVGYLELWVEITFVFLVLTPAPCISEHTFSRPGKTKDSDQKMNESSLWESV